MTDMPSLLCLRLQAGMPIVSTIDLAQCLRKRYRSCSTCAARSGKRLIL
jgi:hypothetical protein